MQPEVRARLDQLLRGARKLADPADPLGCEARARLARSSGLSPANVEWALTHALETHPSDAELEQLALSAAASPRAHVLLSANVFVAAHRAIALALAASASVVVRASRREPEMSELLAEAAPNLFELVSELSVAPGEQLFAYGSAETLAVVAREQPQGTLFHGHGPGFGLVAMSEDACLDVAQRRALAQALAVDIAAFDQRGCLSPRVLLFQGARENALEFAAELATSLARAQHENPRGVLTPAETAEIVRYRDTLSYAGDLFDAGGGYVGVAAADAPFELAPTGRNLHVLCTDNVDSLVVRAEPAITTFACAASAATERHLCSLLPYARPATLGYMQRPSFDGPVDRRPASRGRTL